jgi:hypothetical protein
VILFVSFYQFIILLKAVPSVTRREFEASFAVMASVDEPSRKIHLKRISHVYYTHVSSSIAKQKEFLTDFGFFECTSTSPKSNKTYYRGYGDDPWVYCLSAGDEDKFGGAGFVVESLEDLEYAAKTLPEATAIYELEDAPGGGKGVTFKDPVDGWPMHLVWGQEERKTDLEEDPSFPKLDFNFVSFYCDLLCHFPALLGMLTSVQPKEKTRPANKFQRLEKRNAVLDIMTR